MSSSILNWMAFSFNFLNRVLAYGLADEHMVDLDDTICKDIYK